MIRFLTLQGESGAEIHQKLVNVYGNNAVCNSTVRKCSRARVHVAVGAGVSDIPVCRKDPSSTLPGSHPGPRETVGPVRAHEGRVRRGVSRVWWRYVKK